MNVLSLFDGMSCGQIALNKSNISYDNYYASEVEKNAIKVTQYNYPKTIQIGDVTKWENWNIINPDLLIGGSPCQSLSIVQSKTRENLDGKSKLFFEFVDIKNHYNPKYFLFENVASMNEESKQSISNLLGCEPIYINSSNFSAQERPRYYWTNIPVEINKLPSNNQVLKDIILDEVDEKYYYTCGFDYLGDKSVCATLHINGHDLIKRVQNINYKCHTLTTCGGGNTQKKILINNRVRKLTPLEYERLQTVPDNYTNIVANTNRYNMLGNGWTVDVIAHILSFIPKEDLR